ncbi:glycosyltransferase domain-containing protein [Halobellus inordinatus]|uniref:glycosyltransferase domain-containing protein n=1 Tax=Halobellus inordinatus TaxID=1126236 RepID=UPI00211398E7|nr:glycosyltransferase domain-containing protein [Halobellus ramosii]
MTDEQIVVYTVVFDDFDVILTPRVFPKNVDYVCFTNTPNAVPEGWEIREVEKDGRSARRASRGVKIRPHKYFSEYEYSIYVDGNFHVVSDVSELVDAHLNEVDMLVPSHPGRNCIYDEAESCIELGLGDESTIRSQMERYRDRGFPEQWGLSNTHIMIRRHNDPTVRAAMDKWWDEYRTGAQRDQLSFEFAAWANDISYDHFSVDYFQEGGYFFHYPHKPPGLSGEVWATMLRDDRYRRDRSQVASMGLKAAYLVLRGGNILRTDGLRAFAASLRERMVR